MGRSRAPMGALSLLLSALAAAASAGHAVTATTLYDAKDPITQLNADDFGPTVYGRDKAFFIEFYSSWCGGCIAYAPTFKKLARELAPWASAVEVAAVNCADDRNTDLCQTHSIDMFPTLKYFKYKSSSAADAVKYEEERHKVERVAANVAFLAYNDWRRQEPANWPAFTAVGNTQKVDSLWDPHPTWDFLALVLDDGVPAEVDPKGLVSPFAATVTLDWAGVPTLGVVHARTSHPAVGGQTDKSPGLLVFKKGDPLPIFVARKALVRAELNARIEEYSLLVRPPNARQTAGAGPKAASATTPAPADMAEAEVARDVSGVDRYRVHMGDLTTGLSYMLRQEVGLKQRIGGEELAALKGFVGLLSTHFPGLPPVRRLLFRLSNWLQEQGSAEVGGKAWAAALEEQQTQLGRPLLANGTWVSCQGSQAKFRGYPCSLWTIFHAITVAAYKADGVKDPSYDPRVVLETIHGYVSHFFGCSECVEHFEEHAKNIATKAKAPEDVVLWLWEVHNDANRRTAGSLSADPAFPKEQFPPASLCPDCRGSDGTFDRPRLLAFLLRFYGEGIVVDGGAGKLSPYKVVGFDKDGRKSVDAKQLDLNPKFRGRGEKVAEFEKREILLQRERERYEKDDEQRQSLLGNPKEYGGWTGASGLDASLCILIWLGCMALVGMLYFYFKFRRVRHRYFKTSEHRV